MPEEVEEIIGQRGYVQKTGNERTTSFIIKILTFKRNPLKAKELLVEAFNTLNIKKQLGESIANYVGQSKYDVLLYKRQINNFDTVGAGHPIDFNARTLILVHGTFASTEGSYGGLYLDKSVKAVTF